MDVVDRFTGGSQFVIQLVEAEAGHPPDSEQKVRDALEALHRERPIERVFVSFDASGKSGYYDEEIDVGPYRAYSNAEVTRGIVDFMTGSSLASAGLSFAIVCNPPTRLATADLWYEWAVQRHALHELNAAAAGIVLAAQLVDPNDADARQFFALVRLRLTADDWRSRRGALAAIRPARALADAKAMVDDSEAMFEAFAGYQELALDFYDSGVRRAEHLAGEAARATRRSGGANTAILVPRPFAGNAADRLRQDGVGFVRVRPEGVDVKSMLDEASVNVGELPESMRRVSELFSGKRIRERIEALGTRERSVRQQRAEAWIMAGGKLSLADDPRAKECFARALEIFPDAAAYRAAGGDAVDHGRYCEGIRYYEEALRLEPGNADAWVGYGMGLNAIGDPRAGKALRRTIYLKSNVGRYWCSLGLNYHRRGHYPAACYCFARGKALGDSASSQNYEMVCRSRRAVCPPAFYPPVLFLMRSVILPMRKMMRAGGLLVRYALLRAFPRKR